PPRSALFPYTTLFRSAGYLFVRLGCEPAPLTLGFILGPMMEEHLRRAMLMSRGDPTVFLSKPISLAFLLAAVAAVVVASLPKVADRKSTRLNSSHVKS